jgi:hypothetical protein
MAKYYEILITHAEGTCPALPDHPDFAYKEHGLYDEWECPTHQVFQKMCDVAVARDRIERLKKVKEVERITLFFGGDVKERDCWERKWSNRYQRMLWERRD